MITVEEWRLKMTENVQRTFNRVKAAADNAGKSFSKAQEKLSAGTRQLGRTAQQVRGELNKVGSELGRVFDRAREHAQGFFDRFRAGWRALFAAPRPRTDGADPLKLNAEQAKRLFKDGKLDQSMVHHLTRQPGKGGQPFMALRKQIGSAITMGFRTGGASGTSMLLRGLLRLSGPVALATTAFMVGQKGYSAVKAFEPAARELRMANLDRSPGEQSLLLDRVRRTAATQGFDPEDTAAAFTATRRTLGGSDSAIEAFVSRVGKASGALNMEMMPMVQASAKAMKDFGLPLERTNDFLDSNVKVMAVAGVSYQTLAEAQEQYASAARASNQSMEAANSLFAAFATHGRDPSKAAAELSYAMDQLGKPKTVKGLKTIGVSVFDANKQIRSMEAVVRDLVPALQGIDDVRFNELKQEVGGIRGMRGLFDMARVSGDELLATLNNFKNSKLGLSDQLNAARNDLDLVAQEIENRMKNAWLSIGEGLKPLFVSLQQGLLWVVEGFERTINERIPTWNQWANPLIAKPLDMLDVGRRKATREFQETATQASGGDAGAMRKLVVAQQELQKSLEGAKLPTTQMKITGQLAQLGSFIKDARTAFADRNDPTKQAPPVPDDDEGAPDPFQAGANAIVGGGKQVRNVNVTIQKLVEKLEVRTSTTVREGISQVRMEVEQAFIDIVRGGEAALANG